MGRILTSLEGRANTLLMGLDVGKKAREESRMTARVFAAESERTGFP